MRPTDIKNYSDLLDLFVEREHKNYPNVGIGKLVVSNIGISLKMFDRLKRTYIPGYKSKTSISLRKYLEIYFHLTFIHKKGKLVISEVPIIPKSSREKRMECKIARLESELKILQAEKKVLQNRLKLILNQSLSI